MGSVDKVLITSFVQVNGFDIDLMAPYIFSESQETLINCLLYIINPCPSFNKPPLIDDVDYLTNYIVKSRKKE